MSAAPAFEPSAARRDRAILRRLPRFVTVGLAATVLYGASAGILARYLGPSTASLTAYAVAALFSYAGHKFFTFMSTCQHRFEAPRFVVLTIFGLAVSFALPELLTVGLGVPLAVPVLVTCVLIPVVNYVVLDRWVFARRDIRRTSGTR